jgi:hypothetical protein
MWMICFQGDVPINGSSVLAAVNRMLLVLYEKERLESLAGTMLFLWAVSDTSDKAKEEAVLLCGATWQSKRRNRCGKMLSIGRGDHPVTHKFMRQFKRDT